MSTEEQINLKLNWVDVTPYGRGSERTPSIMQAQVPHGWVVVTRNINLPADHVLVKGNGSVHFVISKWVPSLTHGMQLAEQTLKTYVEEQRKVLGNILAMLGE
jgi:hypothetical protein